MNLVITIFFSLLLTGSVESFAAGGGGMSSPSMSAPQPRKTPEQRAIESYNRGIAARDKAHELEEELASTSSDKQAAKLDKKIRKQYTKAAKSFRSAVKLEPRLYQAHGSLGYALKQLGEFDDALAAYDESLRLKPEYTPAIEYRAEAYLGLGRYTEVIQAHGVLATTDPGHKQQLEKAIEVWLSENERGSSNGEFHDWATSL